MPIPYNTLEHLTVGTMHKIMDPYEKLDISPIAIIHIDETLIRSYGCVILYMYTVGLKERYGFIKLSTLKYCFNNGLILANGVVNGNKLIVDTIDTYDLITVDMRNFKEINMNSNSQIHKIRKTIYDKKEHINILLHRLNSEYQPSLSMINSAVKNARHNKR